MSSDLEILKKIWEAKEEVSIRILSHQTGFGPDYIRYLCSSLIKKGQIKPVKGRRDCFELTFQGEASLKRKGIVDLKISSAKKKANEPEETIEAEEKRLNLGRSIAKAVSYLRNL